MIKNILFPSIFMLAMGTIQQAYGQKESNGVQPKAEVKFLDNISVDIPASGNTQTVVGSKGTQEPQYISKKSGSNSIFSSLNIENAEIIQFKYSLLLDVEVEQIQNLNLFRVIDSWFGTKYRFGGTTKDGIDCSAFMQALFTAIYGISLPRTAKEQYNLSRKIERSELKEGDLVFFNTSGGVSHVGMYLQNNKFVHASSSGVMISDLDDDYYAKRFIGTGRIDEVPVGQSTALISKP